MNKKVILLLVIVFAFLMAGAAVLYDQLSGTVEDDRLASQTVPPTPTTSEEMHTGEEKPEKDEGDQSADTTQTERDEEKIKVPDFKAYDKDGNEVHLYDYLGKPLVLNFWASWCGPCKMEMPEFEAVWQEVGEEVQFLMVNMTGGRETLESAMSFIEEEEYTFPVLYDKDMDAAMTYGVYSLPSTLFVDKEGYVVVPVVGAIGRDILEKGIELIRAAEE